MLGLIIVLSALAVMSLLTTLSLHAIERKLNSMTASIQDLDNALAQEDAALGTLAQATAANDAQITALLNKIAAGGSVDVTAELTKIQGQTASIAAAVAAVAASDSRTS
jgi:hypothetical protein